jgi:hypothetical protein
MDVRLFLCMFVDFFFQLKSSPSVHFITSGTAHLIAIVIIHLNVARCKAEVLVLLRFYGAWSFSVNSEEAPYRSRVSEVGVRRSALVIIHHIFSRPVRYVSLRFASIDMS